jgi:CHASE3 domain sensor protein
VVLLLVVAALLASIALTWQRLDERKDEVRQAQSFLRHLDRLQVALSRLVSAERVFFLTGEERALERAEQAIVALDDGVKTLQALGGGADAQGGMSQLAERIESLVAHARATTRARSTSAAPDERGAPGSPERRALDTEIRLLVDELDLDTSREAALARSAAEQNLRTLFLLAIASAIASAIILVMALGVPRETADAARLARIAGSGVVGIAFWDATGRLIESNAEYDRIVGMPAEAGSQPVYWTEVFVGDDGHLADAAARHVLVSGSCPPFFASCPGDGTARIPVLSWSLRLETKPVQFASFVVDLSRQLATDRGADRVAEFTALVAPPSAPVATPRAPLAAATVI